MGGNGGVGCKIVHQVPKTLENRGPSHSGLVWDGPERNGVNGVKKRFLQANSHRFSNSIYNRNSVNVLTSHRFYVTMQEETV